MAGCPRPTTGRGPTPAGAASLHCAAWHGGNGRRPAWSPPYSEPGRGRVRRPRRPVRATDTHVGTIVFHELLDRVRARPEEPVEAVAAADRPDWSATTARPCSSCAIGARGEGRDLDEEPLDAMSR